MPSLDTKNLTKRAVPKMPYEKARALVLPSFDISLVFATDAKATALNKVLRNKDYIPNVLSYESGPKSGEVIICLAEAKRQHASYGMAYADFVLFLFIHGLMHLKGRSHGTTMEKEERAALARLLPLYRTHEPKKDSNRHRPRNASSKGRRR